MSFNLEKVTLAAKWVSRNRTGVYSVKRRGVPGGSMRVNTVNGNSTGDFPNSKPGKAVDISNFDF